MIQVCFILADSVTFFPRALLFESLWFQRDYVIKWCHSKVFFVMSAVVLTQPTFTCPNSKMINNDLIDVALVSLLLSLKRGDRLFGISVVGFEQVNAG